MKPIESRMIEEESKPPLYARIYMRLRFGRDSVCDECWRRTWWNGNKANAGGIDIVLCDECHASHI